MNNLSNIFSVFFRPFAVFGISFLLVGWGSANLIRYAFFVSAIQNNEIIEESVWENVLSETDSIEDLLITFNYETSFIQPVEFHEDIIAPNVLYSLHVGDGISLSGDAQNPTLTNMGVLSVNGLKGAVTLSAGENVTFVEENGVLTIKSTDTNTDTDTKLTEEEVEAFVFDGESTGEFTDLQIGDILLSDAGSSATTSGSSLVGVYQGNLSEISGMNVQEVIDSIDSTLASLSTSSHAEVTFAGSLDYLTLTGQQITLNQIDLTSDISGILPSTHVSGTYSGITGVGTITSGTWQGNVISSAYLDSSVILSTEIDSYSELDTLVSDVTLLHSGLVDTSAELAAIIGDETGTGALVFGTSPNLTTPSIGAATGTSLSVTGALTAGGVVTGTGSGLSGLNASNLSSGTLPDARLTGTYTGLTSLTGSGTATFGTFSGSGASLTSLNATNLSSGTVASARIAGSYTGITGLGTISSGTWQGTAISSTYLDTNVIVSSEIDTYTELNTVVSDVTLTHNGLIDTSAELAGIVGDETGSGALVFGTSPTFAGNIYLPGSGIWNSSGSVGIGTTNPGATLDVQGAAQFGSGNVDLINSTGKIAAINTTYFASVDGSALTNLNASNLSSGTVPDARISGSYTGITGVGTIGAGTWQGSAISSTYLDTSVILSSEIDTYAELNSVVTDVTLTHNGLIDTSAEIAAIVTNETGSGALVFGTSPTLTTPNIGAANGTSLTLTGALTSGGIITGTGSGLSGLNASNLSSGTLPDARLTGAYTGLTNLTGSGTATFATFSGSGASLTSLNASNLGSGTVPDARISGSYTGLTSLTGSGTATFGTFSGSGASLTSLNASNLSSGTVPDARITGSYTGLTNLTGSGTSTFGSFLLSSNGSAATPAIRWSSDTNMGIYRGGTDILRFSTAGADRLTINATGNVGIATTNPSAAKLVVNGGTGVGMHILNTGDTATGLWVLNWDDGDGIYVESGGGDGIISIAAFGDAVYGEGHNGVHGASYYDNGVFGEALTSSAWAGYFLTPGTPAVARFQNATGTCDVDPTSTTLICSSDERLKTNITTISSALDKVMALRGVNYNWKKDEVGSPNRLGFIAQEVESIFPELVVTDNETGYKQLASSNLIAVVVNAIQEQHQIVLSNKSNIQKADIRLNETGEVLKIVNTQTQKLLADQNNLLNQINLEKSIQDTRMASQAANLESVNKQIKTLEKMTNDTQAVVLGLQDRVSQLENIFMTKTATETALLAGSNEGDVLGTLTDINVESLIVSGDTNLRNLGITGDITAGLLSIKGFDDELGTPSASISTISGPLKIQDQSSGNLEIMGRKVLIDTEGNIKVRGSITVEKLNIDETDESSKSVGQSIIPEGEDTIVVPTNAVTSNSKIFVTVQNLLVPITVTEKKPGESFTIKMGTTAEADTKVDWLIVN